MENKKEDRYKISVAQKAVLYDENTRKFLLLKSKDQKEYYAKLFGSWEIPGGKLEEDESMADGLAREIREEIGEVDFEIVCPINARKVMFDWGPLLLIDYLVKYRGGDIRLSHEHEEFVWQTAEEVRKSGEYKTWLKNIIEAAEEMVKSGEYLEGWKRCQADFENYKKRQAEIQKEAAKYANLDLIYEILPVIDNFHASTAHVPAEEENNPWVTGIMHIQRQLESVLENYGVKEIEIKIGDRFDPNIMEAIHKEEGGEEKGDKVKQVVMRGYKMGDRVIRAARVIV